MAGNPGILHTPHPAQGNMSPEFPLHKGPLYITSYCREFNFAKVVLWLTADCKMNKLAIALFHALLVFFFSPKSSDGQGLRPQPINIAQGKKIEATATCGEDVSEPELFCKLATVPGKLGILGLSCDHCEPDTFTKDHSIKYAIDGTERWWQSPPLSRGLQYQKVNITIDLGQVVFLRIHDSRVVSLSLVLLFRQMPIAVLQCDCSERSVKGFRHYRAHCDLLLVLKIMSLTSVRRSFTVVWKVRSANQLKFQSIVTRVRGTFFAPRNQETERTEISLMCETNWVCIM